MINIIVGVETPTYQLFFLGKKPQKPVKFGAEIELLDLLVLYWLVVLIVFVIAVICMAILYYIFTNFIKNHK